ncbi:TPA: hypothetical protein OTS28_004037 [Klebsiella pneumoniae]|uniref:hypothetical protein n=1 Tax=Klebsiella pneumoniae TaxID=573 RepID=UPI000E0511C7|nr:hypothetical protein [Klebsiella pneumoniae]STU87333.1 Uncharacterised protein [Klebsiella pneumoniae]HCT2688020.1 hypothetical protein [Klebsiella pneumoniae]
MLQWERSNKLKDKRNRVNVGFAASGAANMQRLYMPMVTIQVAVLVPMELPYSAFVTKVKRAFNMLEQPNHTSLKWKI